MFGSAIWIRSLTGGKYDGVLGVLGGWNLLSARMKRICEGSRQSTRGRDQLDQRKKAPAIGAADAVVRLSLPAYPHARMAYGKTDAERP